MSRPFTLTIHARGSLALGGVTGVERDHHSASARDAAGQPFIPATALRGVLRSNLEAVLRGADCPACAGGTGLAPDAPAGARPGPCTLGPESTRCLACRLFGGHHERLPDGAAFFSALVLSDAVRPDDAPPPAWTTRSTVGIRRDTRSARQHVLAQQRVPTSGDELVFVAHGRLLEPDLEPCLSAAVSATTHIGAGRSRGLGRIECALCFDTPAEAPGIAVESDSVRLRLRLVSPACIGVAFADDNLRDTRREIPGSALRGAIGFALAEALDGMHTRERPDAAFERLVAEDGARFGFLYPVDAKRVPLDAAPLPITTLGCKFERHQHPVVDGLLDAIAATLTDSAVIAARVHDTSHVYCQTCGAPLRTLRGPREHRSAVPTRTITRLAMDRQRGSARSEMLFSQVLLEPGLHLEGSIDNIPTECRDRLALALSRPLALGRGRAHGWGRVDVQVVPSLDLPPLPQRAAEFHHALGERLARAGLSTAEATRWVPITLHAPMIPDADDEDGEQAILRVLPDRVAYKARRFTREGGWDQREHGLQPALAVAAGAVFAVQLPESARLEDLLPRLAQLERDGLGLRRHQGYGALRCFDPIHR
ncbi:RAMP superfamily CRISPR-associated protein [Nannocystis sp. ILAH1]|uniref:RAMP superfamily CRISPR-associated protein n=1 Tax=Nannocystis sp. ILAH1 TaxID=2996789 RepID=UPI00227216AB|nr:RAMP superfamily CRISPR-associated protein [Nannocystis sp. ILAH1]MCY0989704.1 RAMP superfamily CRISPR-associated protein [Nannocystis sp. ILAH1]